MTEREKNTMITIRVTCARGERERTGCVSTKPTEKKKSALPKKKKTSKPPSLLLLLLLLHFVPLAIKHRRRLFLAFPLLLSPRRISVSTRFSFSPFAASVAFLSVLRFHAKKRAVEALKACRQRGEGIRMLFFFFLDDAVVSKFLSVIISIRRFFGPISSLSNARFCSPSSP